MFPKHWFVVLLVSTTSSIALFYIYFRKKKNNIPILWKQVGEIEKIIMYPIKSGRANEIKEANCTEEGLREIDNESRYSFRDRLHLINFKLIKLTFVICVKIINFYCYFCL